jgi:hypothetical protein
MVRALGGFFYLAATLGGFAGTAHAVTHFQYDSICYSNCVVIGLDSGDPVSAMIGFDDAAVVGLGTADGDDVVSFDATFGSQAFEMSSLSLESVDVTFDAAAAAATSFYFASDASGDDPGFLFDQDFWMAGPSTTEVATGGSGSLTLVPPAPTALPALSNWFQLVLVAVLMGAGMGAWRRRAA